MKIDTSCFSSDSKITEMIDSLGGINYNDSSGITPLCFASLNGISQSVILNLIVKYGADANMQCELGSDPLSYAISTGTTDPVIALIGGDVIKRDSNGDPIETSVPKQPYPQYKKDAENNPLPSIDENGGIVYRLYKGVPIPFNDGDLFDSDKNRQRCKINNTVTFVPPQSSLLHDDCKFSKITYLMDKDGNHVPMSDANGKPIRQCYSDGNEIHKKNSDGKTLKNNYEYVWDYKKLPQYQIAYEYETISLPADKAATITDKKLFEASSLPSSNVLDVMIHRYCYCANGNHNKIFFGTFGDDNSTPIFKAATIGCIDSINLIKTHDVDFVNSVNSFNDNTCSAATVVASSNNNDLIDSLKDYIKPIQSDMLQTVEAAIMSEDIPESARPDMLGMYMPLLVNIIYGSNFYNVLYTSYYTFPDQVTIQFVSGKIALDYIETALRCIYYNNSMAAMKRAIIDGFIFNGTAKRLFSDDSTVPELPLIEHECYTILNLLHENGCFDDLDIEYINEDIRAIVDAVADGRLNTAKLNNWPWWDTDQYQ